MLFDFLGQQVSVHLWLERHESLSEAGRECRHWLLDAHLGPGNLGSIARVEVIQGLCGGQPGDRGQHGESITGQENDILGVASNSRQQRIVDVLEGVRDSGVLGDAGVEVVDLSGGLLERHIF